MMKSYFEVTFNQYQSIIVFNKYRDNQNTAIELVGAPGTKYAGEPIAMATVNTGDKLSKDMVAIKDWSENTGMIDALKDSGIIGEWSHSIPCGFVEAQVYYLTEKTLNAMKQE